MAFGGIPGRGVFLGRLLHRGGIPEGLSVLRMVVVITRYYFRKKVCQLALRRYSYEVSSGYNVK